MQVTSAGMLLYKAGLVEAAKLRHTERKARAHAHTHTRTRARTPAHTRLRARARTKTHARMAQVLRAEAARLVADIAAGHGIAAPDGSEVRTH